MPKLLSATTTTGKPPNPDPKLDSKSVKLRHRDRAPTSTPPTTSTPTFTSTDDSTHLSHVPHPHTQWLVHYPDPSAPTKPIPKPLPKLKPYCSKWKSEYPNLKSRAGRSAKFGPDGIDLAQQLPSSTQNYYGGYPGMMGGGMGMYPGMMGMGGMGMGGMGMYPGMMGGYGVSQPLLRLDGALSSRGEGQELIKAGT